MINQYKRCDVFKCAHLSHKKFGSRVSVYHVLKVKKCYPAGCISFEGICRLMNKGHNCIKGYNYVGVNCTSCSYFKESKIMRKPEILLDKNQYEQFTEELDQFEDWIKANKGRLINVRGIISWIKPRFEKRIFKKNESLNLNGFIIGFKKGYIDIDSFDDHLYAVLSVNNQEKWRFCRGDEIEFIGEFNVSNGMITFDKIRNVEVISRDGSESPPTKNDAEVALKIGKIHPERNNKCVNCPSGSLIYVKYFTHKEPKSYRRLICVEGYEHHSVCKRVNIPDLGENFDECKEGKLLS